MGEIIMPPEQRRGTVAVLPQDNSIMAVISRAAADPSCDIDKLERLMAMHERMQARDAEAEFNAAMAAMQSDIPSIAERGAIVVNGQKRSEYATFEDINDVIKPIMQEHGFAITFKVENVAAGLSVTGILMHRAGHRESTTMLLPLDTSGTKNAVQAVGSSTSYGKRYVMSALLNLTTRGEDDDGHAAVPVATVTAAQARQLQGLLDKCSDRAKTAFANMHGTPAEVQKAAFDQVLGMLGKSAKQNEVATQGGQDADHH
ncbi:MULTISPECIES: ERF family protein [unclassified Pseudomonas]|uniref:ERF family protein n=1 Tax=unclassified Pseudomonas TaxID=196821 RepID=UPI000BCDABB4|nr:MULTISPECIES: ERF family protein [unclassified Pseudomonas]PVZ19961.1 ERF superfamily protein [Pseudomonas sp. URIL14HWK12:I12]PVZ27027.1 ERF superfamily protein [Pseudomonas sp. URIL14HWK12:I10]PVZ37916.1 ERF superfamily protein [Pseudomonas sp. URIL14HWK12:I11]SNZ05154.1 ERF superfamily protein [Pseudomonas sp. URIL14HWK12:I9]